MFASQPQKRCPTWTHHDEEAQSATGRCKTSLKQDHLAEKAHARESKFDGLSSLTRPSHAWSLTSTRDTLWQTRQKQKKIVKFQIVPTFLSLLCSIIVKSITFLHPVPPQSLQILYTTALWTTFSTPTPLTNTVPRHDPPSLFNHFETISQNVIKCPSPPSPPPPTPQVAPKAGN